MNFIGKHKNYFLFIVWFVTISIPIAYLQGLHMYAFNKFNLNIFSENVIDLNSKRLELTHILSTSCGCSRKIINYLIDRGPSSVFSEKVILIDDKNSELEMALINQKYSIKVVSSSEAYTKYNIQSVPQLVIRSTSRLEYQGGYNENQFHNSHYKDLELAHKISENNSVSEFPLFGCSNSKLTKNIIDPFGVKYE